MSRDRRWGGRSRRRPVPGRTSYPLLFDRAGRPKPAFDAVVGAVRAALSSKQLTPAR